MLWLKTLKVMSVNTFQSEKQVSCSINALAWWKENEQFCTGLLNRFKERVIPRMSNPRMSNPIMSNPIMSKGDN